MKQSKPKAVIAIAWRTCPSCGAKYDNGNPYASFYHRGECTAAASSDTTQGEEQ